jgi:hypothetical protein
MELSCNLKASTVLLREQSPRHPVDRRLDGLQKRKNITLARIE